MFQVFTLAFLLLTKFFELVVVAGQLWLCIVGVFGTITMSITLLFTLYCVLNPLPTEAKPVEAKEANDCPKEEVTPPSNLVIKKALRIREANIKKTQEAARKVRETRINEFVNYFEQKFVQDVKCPNTVNKTKFPYNFPTGDDWTNVYAAHDIRLIDLLEAVSERVTSTSVQVSFVYNSLHDSKRVEVHSPMYRFINHRQKIAGSVKNRHLTSADSYLLEFQV